MGRVDDDGVERHASILDILGEALTITFDGRPYLAVRRPGPVEGTVTEHLLGIGLIRSERTWRGHSYSRRATWCADRNPAGTPSGATAYVDGLSPTPSPVGGA